MLKAVIGDPPSTLIIGLSVLNLERLTNSPVLVFGDEVGLDFDIMIQAGGSEAIFVPDILKIRDRKVCVLGLQGDVLKSLTEPPGRTIAVIRNVNGITINLFSGKDEASMATGIDELIGPETRVVTDPRLRN